MNIQVNDALISEHDINVEMQHHPADNREHAQREAAHALVVRALLLQEATQRGLCGTPAELDEDAAQEVIRRLTQEAVAVPQLSEAECRRYFDENRDRFRGPDIFAPSHILFGARTDDIDGRIEAKQAAEEALKQLAKKPERFGRMAQERSACPSGAGGGSLGQIQKGETLGEFERALRTLEPGETHQMPIETDHGFHILRLDARVEGKPVPFESVHDRVRIYLRDRAWRLALKSFIDELAAAATIDGFELH